MIQVDLVNELLGFVLVGDVSDHEGGLLVSGVDDVLDIDLERVLGF